MASQEHAAELPAGAGEALALRSARAVRWVLGGALIAVAAIDVALISRGHLLAGAIADGVVLVALLNFAAWNRSAGAPVAAAALRALALVPLARLVAAGMPVSRASAPLAELMVVLPVGYAVFRFAPLVGVSIRGLIGAGRPRARWRPTGADAAAMTGGGALGLVAYLLGAPSLIPAHPSAGRVVLALAAVTAVAAVEELLFRGLLQTTLQRVDPRVGFVGASAVFACTYVAAGSAALALTVALAGLTFAYAFAQSGDLRSAIAGHWELGVGAFVLWPALFGRHSTALAGPGATAVLAVVVAIAVVAAVRRLGAGAPTPHADPKA